MAATLQIYVQLHCCCSAPIDLTLTQAFSLIQTVTKGINVKNKYGSQMQTNNWNDY